MVVAAGFQRAKGETTYIDATGILVAAIEAGRQARYLTPILPIPWDYCCNFPLYVKETFAPLSGADKPVVDPVRVAAGTAV